MENPLEKEYSMNDITAVRQAVDRMLTRDLDPMLDLLADDVTFCVTVGGDEPMCLEDSGKQPVVDYFTALGGLVSFWQMDYTAGGDQLIAWGRESFTIESCELEGGCEFALVFDVADGLITRFMVVEDLRAFLRGPHTLQTPDWFETIQSGSAPFQLVGA
jgi:ketosteroid isomerase-like protein